MLARARRELVELREGARILASRDFWRAFWAYWRPEAINGRLEDLVRRLEEGKR